MSSEEPLTRRTAPSTGFGPRRAALRETLPRFAMVMAALIALAAFPQSALFAIERLDVRGASMLAPETIATIAGLREGARLFAVDAEDVLRRLKADPRIKDAAILIKPPRTIRLDVVERRPLVALAVGDAFALLGDDLVAVAVGPDSAGLPEVVDRIRPVPWARAGAPVASDAARAVLTVLPNIPAAIRVGLRQIIVAPGSDFTLVLRSGLRIRAGGPAGLAERLAGVPAVLEALRARDIAVAALDLRYAGSIAVTLSTGGEAP
ncbi:MAG: FtsQ-type POTRA domain-containing protein [Armatimonadota bacterium]|nr:FtsQ-type POTRA domain-containing protein [Armatimonadota bacterium]